MITRENINEIKDKIEEFDEKLNKFATVIPVNFHHLSEEYKGPSEFMIEQLRINDDFVPDHVSKNSGSLYSVSQLVLPANENFSERFPDEMQLSNKTRSQTPNPELNSTINNYNGCKIPQKAFPSSSSCSKPPKGQENTTEGYTSVCIYLHNKMAFLMEIEDNPHATSDCLCQIMFASEELNLNSSIASQVFSLWMRSPLLELQLRDNQKPYLIHQKWKYLLDKYSHGTVNARVRDEPLLYLQRNVFFSRACEEKIKDPKILELLYEEARDNILNGRYPCEISHYIMLGGIQARIELGPYNPQLHTIHYFREEQAKYLPLRVRKSSTWTWLPISSKSSAEVRLLEQFKRIPAAANNKKLIKKYLDFCWSLPFYGSAFFEGQIEQPVRSLISFLTHQDVPVLVAINRFGLHIIDDLNCTVLLGLRYDEFNWEYARPSNEDNFDCLPCLFLQFMVVENGTRVSKILQIFSKQAPLMDTLISVFVNESNYKINEESNGRANEDENDLNSYTTSNLPSLCTKLNKLTLATFDEDGHLIGQTGSLSFTC